MSSYIIAHGMLVKVGSVLDKEFKVGIIIGRSGIGLGFNDDWWEVLVNGSIMKLTGTSIWPIETYSQTKAWQATTEW
tara:strand:- start:203 stop:433 length:231 start_codon:yes stop_codon:yes gene_type:complete